MDEVRWRDLKPEPAVLGALAEAGSEATRQEIRDEAHRVQALPSEAARRRERAVLRNMRKRWSERFATACATMIAGEIRQHTAIRRHYEVLPDQDGGSQETFTPLGYQSGKRIDVVVFGPLVGLQIGVSLKGLNFADDASRNHDKNLTGRLYELRDEVSTVHDYLPRAFMTTVFFLPVSGCFDKATAPSSFAHIVSELGSRTGRLDPSVAAHAWRCDFAGVGLYVPGDPDDEARELTPGVARFFAIGGSTRENNWAPVRGLPKVASTLSISQFVDRLIEEATVGTAASARYAPAEEGSDPVPNDAADEVESLDEYDLDEDEELDPE